MELLVVIMIIIILAGILMPSLQAARVQMLRAKCGNNLRAIGQGCLAYSQDSTKTRSSQAGVLPSVATALNDWAGTHRGLWLLIQYEMVGREYFLCPEAELRRDLQAPSASDTEFTATTCSYAYLAQPYGANHFSTTPSVEPGGGGMIILADDNPLAAFGGGGTGMPTSSNSENHNGDGQNVADVGGAVKWVQSPVLAVASNRNDNIYVQGDNGAAGAANRLTVDDIYLIP